MIKQDLSKIIKDYSDTEGPDVCLNCGSDALSLARLGKHRILVTCVSCNSKWYELYTFTGLGEAP